MSIHRALTRLFSVSPATKRQCAAEKLSSPLDPGFSPFGIASAMDTGIPNLLETWDIGDPVNKWPDFLARDYELITSFQQMLSRNAMFSLKMIAYALQINFTYFSNILFGHEGGIHLIHYLPTTKSAPLGARRQSEHCDNTFITLIPPPSPGHYGLSVFDRRSASWHDIKIPKDACLVQLGRLLEYITAGDVLANLHTVRTPSHDDPDNTERYSTPFFLSPSSDRILSVVPGYRTEGTIVGYPDLTIGQLQDRYFAKIFRRTADVFTE